MQVHLVDGTYELFRQFYGRNSGHTNAEGTEVGAVRGALRSTFALLNDGATHVGVATDHVIESFRNDLYEGYKTGEGIDPTLFSQFGLFEDALRAAGFTVWAMVEQEADDALAAAALIASGDDRVERVVILTPDKDLGQCCAWPKVVQYDRRNQAFRDADGVREKFGVDPESIPDWLGLVGDTADGFPGLPGWGAKSAAAVLAHYKHLEHVPDAPGKWEVTVRGAAKLAATLTQQRDDAYLFRTIATLQTDAEVGVVDDWRWAGPSAELERYADLLDAPDLIRSATTLVNRRSA
ncbi:5'-3' exonuclease [Candidatus Microthrix sp.]|jgi:5'-3' exonuclease|uniref:5'-3' exonuclease n=1 Tax=Candidatus Neomicrothrix sp. TaxID=2719034 RepID=UPI00259340E7|nr:5'-3' exonuclease H3TH domain-containing protein [Candidatus Microthrix sp.]HMS46455.1 5'-3' exonuclease H3TH domain-containing protein [Candidatus Microthrix sp.]